MNILRIIVENPDDLLNASAFGAGALLRLESSSDNDTFVEFNTTAIVTQTTLYTVYHSAGTSSTWYRTRYSNSGGTTFSEYSASFQLGGPPIEYASVAAVKSLLKITDTNDDSLLTSIVTDVNEWIESFIGFPVGPVGSEARTFDGSAVRHGGRCLAVYPFGVRSVSSVKTRSVTGGTQTTLGASDVLLRPHSFERPTGWPAFEIWISDVSGTESLFPTSGYDVIEVTATWGWAAVPPELAAFGNRLAITRYRRRAAGSGRSLGLGPDGEQIFEDEMTANDWRILERYRSLTGFSV